jgi:hypothetical protein
MSLTLATWTGAIATVILAVGAIASSIVAVRSLSTQLKTMALQQLQTQRQGEVLSLQAKQLEESLALLVRETGERRRSEPT